MNTTRLNALRDASNQLSTDPTGLITTTRLEHEFFVPLYSASFNTMVQALETADRNASLRESERTGCRNVLEKCGKVWLNTDSLRYNLSQIHFLVVAYL